MTNKNQLPLTFFVEKDEQIQQEIEDEKPPLETTTLWDYPT